MHPVALVLLSAEITDELISRTRQFSEAAGRLEPTEPAQFRAFLAAMIADLQRQDHGGAQLQRLQHYNRCLGQLGVESLASPYVIPMSTTTYRPRVA